jgi:hypothetical protein
MTTPTIAVVDPTTSRARTWGGAVVAVGVAWTLMAGGFTPEPLYADPTDDPDDTDLDGMPNTQEFVLGTSQFVPDTDGDGYLDAHELAFQSNPMDNNSVPVVTGTADLRVGITARGESGQLRLHVALYSATGTFETSVLRVGALANGQFLSVPFHRLLPFADVREVDVLAQGTTGSAARVRTIDLTLNPIYVHAFGETTFFIAVGANGQLTYSSAAKVDIASVQQTLVLRRDAYTTQQTQTTPGGGGSLRQPIPTTGPGGVPGSWVAGQICYQRSSVTGMIGAKVVHEITSANCLMGWDTFCPVDCAASIGDTYETVDPASLIGG